MLCCTVGAQSREQNNINKAISKVLRQFHSKTCGAFDRTFGSCLRNLYKCPKQDFDIILYYNAGKHTVRAVCVSRLSLVDSILQACDNQYAHSVINPITPCEASKVR